MVTELHIQNDLNMKSTEQKSKTPKPVEFITRWKQNFNNIGTFSQVTK